MSFLTLNNFWLVTICTFLKSAEKMLSFDVHMWCIWWTLEKWVDFRLEIDYIFAFLTLNDPWLVKICTISESGEKILSIDMQNMIDYWSIWSLYWFYQQLNSRIDKMSHNSWLSGPIASTKADLESWAHFLSNDVYTLVCSLYRSTGKLNVLKIEHSRFL